MPRPPIDTSNDGEIRALITRLQDSLGFHGTAKHEALPVDRRDLVAVTELAERGMAVKP